MLSIYSMGSKQDLFGVLVRFLRSLELRKEKILIITQLSYSLCKYMIIIDNCIYIIVKSYTEMPVAVF